MNIISSNVLLSDHRISLFCKSWLVFYRFGLLNPDERILLSDGSNYKPWTEIRNYRWRVPGCNLNNNIQDIHIVNLWNKYLEFWCESTLNNKYFYVDYIIGVGLGLFSKSDIPISMNFISSHIIGLLEYVDLVKFNELNAMNYNSLYKYNREFSILFGPLSLVNCSNCVDFNFNHLIQYQGKSLQYLLTYQSYKEPVYKNNESDEIQLVDRNGVIIPVSFNYKIEMSLNIIDNDDDNSVNINTTASLPNGTRIGLLSFYGIRMLNMI